MTVNRLMSGLKKPLAPRLKLASDGFRGERMRYGRSDEAPEVPRQAGYPGKVVQQVHYHAGRMSATRLFGNRATGNGARLFAHGQGQRAAAFRDDGFLAL